MLCRRYPLRATRLAADAVSPNVVLFVYYTLRATASRPSPILAARDYVSPVADAVPMPVLLHAWRARVMCTCGRCLAFSPNVIMIPFVFKRVHKHATSHHPVQMFLQSCCTFACSQLAIITSLPARLASLRHVHMWALPHVLAERYHDTVRVQTRSHACDLADLSSSCANVPAGLLHLHALSSRSSDCMPRVFTRMRRVPAGLKTRRSRLRAARRRCPAAACMPVLLAS